MGSSYYYRNRAICRKIIREGTGLACDRMETDLLEQRLRGHLSMLVAYVSDSEISNIELVRAIVQVDEITTELDARRHLELQMSFFESAQPEPDGLKLRREALARRSARKRLVDPELRAVDGA